MRLLKIRLLCEDQDIWRVVAVPASYTYEQLHRLIQIIFNWRNEH
ncbi:MAG: plasmid pRiA4b ORF-3 family protein, partial [Ruminococcaceae bacterium]|nr:plasmid pRiA4b ORF-3 family protein [Oscillospiraceae bacterium]